MEMDRRKAAEILGVITDASLEEATAAWRIKRQKFQAGVDAGDPEIIKQVKMLNDAMRVMRDTAVDPGPVIKPSPTPPLASELTNNKNKNSSEKYSIPNKPLRKSAIDSFLEEIFGGIWQWVEEAFRERKLGRLSVIAIFVFIVWNTDWFQRNMFPADYWKTNLKADSAMARADCTRAGLDYSLQTDGAGYWTVQCLHYNKKVSYDKEQLSESLPSK